MSVKFTWKDMADEAIQRLLQAAQARQCPHERLSKKSVKPV